MKKIEVKTASKNYNICFCDTTKDIAVLIPGKINSNSKNFLITDDNVNSIYQNLIKSLREKLDLHLIVLGHGEASKSLGVMEKIYDNLLEAGCDRKSTLIGFGGGVVGDITGFAAGTVFRGISCIQIPTTLLAQSDSSVGGKTGVNHARGKNLIGVFHQPEMVIIDLNFLATLPEEQYLSGMGEVVKSGLIGDAGLVRYIRQNNSGISRNSIEHNRELVYRSIQVKRKVVEEDERESGLRMILNYGHTIGHGIEKSLPDKITHGEAVLLGMYASNLISMDKNILDGPALKTINDLLTGLIGKVSINSIDVSKVLNFMIMDKKWFGSKRNFIVLSDIAKPEILKNVEMELIETAVKRINTFLQNMKE